MKASTRRTIIIISVVLMAVLAIILAVSLTGPTEIDFSKTSTEDPGLEQLFYEGKVEALFIEGNFKVKIKVVGEKGFSKFCYIGSRASFQDTLDGWRADPNALSKNTTVIYNDPSSSSMLSSILVPIIMLVLLTVVFMFIMRKSSGANNQAMSFGKTQA
ncbi:MAG: hypothetical protein RSB09_04950, partial [Clostridia bacterium]